MSSRRLKVESVQVEDSGQNPVKSIVKIVFSRKLTALEVSGVKAVLDGEIK
jgi:hypothetical protein